MIHTAWLSVARVPVPLLSRSSSKQWWYLEKSFRKQYHRSSGNIRPFLLADIGEGITECQVIQWFVKPGARVEQFDRICEVQSDKASVEITSPFDGIVRTLHYEPDDMAVTGRPLVDFEVDHETALAQSLDVSAQAPEEAGLQLSSAQISPQQQSRSQQYQKAGSQANGVTPSSLLATPAVRHLLKTHGLKATSVHGSGRDGRILKDDVLKHMATRSSGESSEVLMEPAESTEVKKEIPEAKAHPLSGIKLQMFKAMSRSLQIPHFLYTTSTDISAISRIRQKHNKLCNTNERLTHLAIILKATSMALTRFPLLNASLLTKETNHPALLKNTVQNFGVAMDTPKGLLVPVIRDIQALTILDIAQQIRLLSEKARDNRLGPQDFSNATFTVSNIGSIGGGIVSPVITSPQVAILGIGRSRVVPTFDASGGIKSREELSMSWSADHRIVDGAECARCAEYLAKSLEHPEMMLLEML